MEIREPKITVEFKERYMRTPVRRTCINVTRKEVIELYGLKEPDIEWYKFIDPESE